MSFAPKITAEDRALDLSRPAVALARRVRALSPHVGATLAIDGQPFKVWRARALPDAAPAPIVAGEGRLVAATGEGSLELLELQPPGRGRMEAASFLRGWRGPARGGGGRWLRPRTASRASAASPCACCAASTRARTPTAPSRRRRGAPTSTRGPAPRRPAWRTGPCSAAARSTGSSTAPSTAPPPSSRRSATSCASARTSWPSPTACPRAPRSTRPCARPAPCAAPRRGPQRAPGSSTPSCGASPTRARPSWRTSTPRGPGPRACATRCPTGSRSASSPRSARPTPSR